MTNKEITNAYYGADQVEKIYLGSDVIWPAQEPGPGPGPEPAHDYSKDYLTIEALGSGMFRARNFNGQYNKNGEGWLPTGGTIEFLLDQGDKIQFRYDTGQAIPGFFSGNTISFKVYGNIESMEYGDNFSGQTTIRNASAFTSYFQNSTGLADASNLILPATTLKATCYYRMFHYCVNLEKAPELPAPTLLNNSYRQMFRSCRKLNYIKCLATAKATDSTTEWVYGVQTTSGTFVKDPSAGAGVGQFWGIGIGGIPENWTIVDAT